MVDSSFMSSFIFNQLNMNFYTSRSYCNLAVLLAFFASIIFSYLLLLLNHNKNGMSSDGDVMKKKTNQSSTWGENLRSNSFKETIYPSPGSLVRPSWVSDEPSDLYVTEPEVKLNRPQTPGLGRYTTVCVTFAFLPRN